MPSGKRRLHYSHRTVLVCPQTDKQAKYLITWSSRRLNTKLTAEIVRPTFMGKQSRSLERGFINTGVL